MTEHERTYLEIELDWLNDNPLHEDEYRPIYKYLNNLLVDLGYRIHIDVNGFHNIKKVNHVEGEINRL